MLNRLVCFAFAAVLSACASTPSGPPAPPPASPPHTERSEALLQALLALGIEYQSGGRSPALGFDCSGLVAHVFLQAYGLRLPHSARSQSAAGRPVSLAELEAGDLVFYDTQGRPYSHVGIYVGDGRFVHSPKSGARVRVERLDSAYWRGRFNGARRVDASR